MFSHNLKFGRFDYNVFLLNKCEYVGHLLSNMVEVLCASEIGLL